MKPDKELSGMLGGFLVDVEIVEIAGGAILVIRGQDMPVNLIARQLKNGGLLLRAQDKSKS